MHFAVVHFAGNGGPWLPVGTADSEVHTSIRKYIPCITSCSEGPFPYEDVT